MNYCGFILLLKIIMNENQFKNSMSLELKISSALNVCFVLFCSVTHSKTKKKKKQKWCYKFATKFLIIKNSKSDLFGQNQFEKNL